MNAAILIYSAVFCYALNENTRGICADRSIEGMKKGAMNHDTE